MRTRSLGAAALALLTSDYVYCADAAAVDVDGPPGTIMGFANAVSGDGFLAVPIGTVPRPPRLPDAKGKRAGAAFEDQLKNMNFFYATDVNIGTPAQKVTVLVDTGSSELWVNPDCTTAPSQRQYRQCLNFGRYDPGKSQTPPFGPFGKEDINYGDPSDSSTQTSVSIRYYRDTIALGDAKIRNQTFGVVAASKGQSQGIMGLAPDLRGGFKGEGPYSLVLSTMAKQGVIASRVFALDLRHSDADTGAVIYGGLDRSKFIGGLERRPIVRGLKNEFRLAVELTTVGVTLQSAQNFKVAGADANVMLDSGTTISRMHAAVALPILQALDAQDDGEGYYQVPCALAGAQGSVDFGFGGKTIRVPLRDFVVNLTGSAKVCYVGMVLTTDQQILGDSVLRAGYFVFDWDNEAVHIAQAANCGSNDIVAVGSGANAVPQVSGNCKDSDAKFTGSPQPTRTRQASYPTRAYTTVYTITSCPSFDSACQTGVVTTQTVQPAPSTTSAAAPAPAASTGKGKDSAGVRPAALTGALVVFGALAALRNVFPLPVPAASIDRGGDGRLAAASSGSTARGLAARCSATIGRAVLRSPYSVDDASESPWPAAAPWSMRCGTASSASSMAASGACQGWPQPRQGCEIGNASLGRAACGRYFVLMPDGVRMRRRWSRSADLCSYMNVPGTCRRRSSGNTKTSAPQHRRRLSPASPPPGRSPRRSVPPCHAVQRARPLSPVLRQDGLRPAGIPPAAARCFGVRGADLETKVGDVGAPPDPPDSITVDEFINSERHGRFPFAAARNPYTCGLTGASHRAADVPGRIDCLARAIGKRLGLVPHEGCEWDRVVGLYSLNTIDYIPLTHAVHRLSGIVTPASAVYSSQELEHQLRSSGAKALFTCVPLLGNALKAAKAAGIPEDRVFLLPVPTAASDAPFLTIDDLIAEGRGLPPLAPLKWSKGQGARQTAYLCYSSGTSGLPKAVMISHRNVIANVVQICAIDSVSRKELGVETQTTLGVLPFSHIYGLVLVALVGQYRGDQVVVLPKFDLTAFLAAVQTYKIEQLSVVPPMLIQIIGNRDKCSKYDLSSVRWVFSGAAPLGSEVIDDLLRLYPKWHLGQGYGMTEASPSILGSSETDCLFGSSGSLIPGAIAKVIDAEGKVVTEYETRGELLVQSPSVVLGYLNNEKANAETFIWDDDGRWLKTDDEVLVRKSKQGNEHFVVTDRIKELIKVKARTPGHQVAPAELEAHLLAHPFVSDCTVIPVPDARAGEVLKAFVVKAEEAKGKPDEHVVAAICKHVEEHKARHKWLKGGVEFIDVVPKSPSGKILRRLLRDREAQARKKNGARL
ncbi:putative 4-coumarate--CoA ligase 1 [Tolypocladium ophioglossoides CBS 100239]|uniref:Putative 4-coumarate--CoA ligase 1 n=1 Tax=Tolypocladium ophioglossoides (strain CBS 100239) TaxID=1163406 RepID=A0A0L0NEU9_TOLOC|nr:putative 4-coumarate--CoA ligase 1 [Tolypocladium ophioglossoides CBS 100239]